MREGIFARGGGACEVGILTVRHCPLARASGMAEGGVAKSQ